MNQRRPRSSPAAVEVPLVARGTVKTVGAVMLALRHERVDVDLCLLRRSGEAALNARLQPWNQRLVAEPLPALLRVMDRDDRPAAG